MLTPSDFAYYPTPEERARGEYKMLRHDFPPAKGMKQPASTKVQARQTASQRRVVTEFDKQLIAMQIKRLLRQQIR